MGLVFLYFLHGVSDHVRVVVVNPRLEADEDPGQGLFLLLPAVSQSKTEQKVLLDFVGV